MKVLHVESGMHLYGGALQVVFLMRGLKALGVENVLACPTGSAMAQAGAEHAELHAMPMKGDTDVGLVGRLRRLVRETRPDVIHLHSRRGADLWGALAGRLEGIPVVLSRRVDNPESPLVVKLKYRLYDRVITISDGIRQVLRAEGVPEAKLRLVHSSVDTEQYRPDRSQRAWLEQAFNLPADALVIGMVAQFIPRKGHQTLLQALPSVLQAHPRSRVILFGQGPQFESVQQAIQASAILTQHVQLAGFRNDLHRILPNLDLLAHPAFMEGLGVSLLQAAACGVPIIAARTGGIPEVVQHGVNGLLITPGDVAGLADSLDQLLSSANTRARMGLAGRTHIESTFSVDAMIQGNRLCYDEVSGLIPRP
jgi:glycosyltransferase involved in cell wall biosynthesis